MHALVSDGRRASIATGPAEFQHINAELKVVVIDNLSGLKGLREAEAILSHSRSIYSRTINWECSAALAHSSCLPLLCLPGVNKSLAPSSSYRFH